MNTVKNLLAKSLCVLLSVSTFSLAQAQDEKMSFSCTTEVTVGEGETKDLTFKLVDQSQGQLLEAKKRFEVILPVTEVSEVKIENTTLSLSSSYNPVNGHYDVSLKDLSLDVPGDSEPLVMTLGASVSLSESVSQRFEYYQWNTVDSPEGKKKVASIYSFKCLVAAWPQFKE